MTPPSGLRIEIEIDGRYRLLYKLKTGGMGVIYVALDLLLERLVAVKMMGDDVADDPEGAVRFEREAKGLAKLGGRSDYAVQVFDYGVFEGVPYLVMELLHGEDLAARLAAVGALPLADVSRIALQLKRVIKRAHQLGIVHRDIKPANIFLSRRDEEEMVKLLDFGALKNLGPSRRALQTQPIGTLPYMSPEQIQGKAIDCRVDLWAFAAVLFEMATGKPPFDGQSFIELIQQICWSPAPRPSLVAPHLAGLDPFFERAFAKAPEDRYASAEDLLQAFAAALRVSLPPPSSNGAVAPSIPALAGVASLESPAQSATLCPTD